MSSRLIKISDWPGRFENAHYTVKTLAGGLGVTPRTVERFMHGSTSLTPHQAMNEDRQTRALPLLAAGKSVKETADLLEPV